MNLAICSLASSSMGNCYLVRSRDTAVLVDAGISAKQIRLGLSPLHMQLSDLAAVFITHEHADHVKGLATLSKQCGVRILASSGTMPWIKDHISSDHAESFRAGDEILVGDLLVSSFSVSHDAADPVGYCFSSGGSKIAIVTDTGIITDEICGCMKDADILVLESNHDVSVLRMGRYPWFLKQRILGDKGHLSNEAAAEALVGVLKEEAASGTLRSRMVLLAHLSKENNFPEMALATMENILQENGFMPGRETRIAVLERTAPSPLYIV